MKEIIILILIAGFLFISSLTILLVGLFQKNKIFIFISIGICVLFVATVSYTGWRIVTQSYYQVSEIVKPRTGEEIYTALFGKPQYGPLTIINYQDQVIPKVDYGIMLHFKTSPAELERILAIHKFTSEKVSTKGWNTNENHWFKPELLGETVLVYKYQKDEYGNIQMIYSNLDRTEMYCIDIQD